MRKRVVFLVTAILLGLAVLAIAYPYAQSGGALTGY